MSESSFTPPEVDDSNESMPAFHFVSRIATDENKAVYLVKQKSLDRKAAIKIYSPKLSRSPEFRESFAATTKVMAKLKHPNLIGVYDSGLEKDMLYLVTEFVAGKPLWNSTKGDPVHLKHVQTLTEGICVGMAHAHKNEICHGALSLKNVLIDENRMPKIGGFSQAQGNTSQLDPSALRFRAPEMAEEEAKPTPQSDIYSIGVILREMAVGQTEGLEALGKIEKIGPALKRLVDQATSADPSKRHRSVEQFYEELLDAFDESAAKKAAGGKLLAAGSPGGTKPGGPRAGTSPSRPGGPTSPSKPVAPVKPSSPAKLWLHIIVIIVLLFAIRVAWNAYENKKARNQAAESAAVSSDDFRVVRAPRPSNYNRPQNRNTGSTRNSSGVDEFPDDPNPQPVVEPARKDPAKELMRLRHALSRGSRSEMPDGTVELANDYFYYVDIPMTWRDAFWFAMEHGGHLAIPGRKASADWMRRKLALDSDSEFWVGAAKSGRYAWTLADGRPWRPKDPSLSLGEYVAVGAQGQLVPHEGQVKRDFVIQWSKDGINPGSLESLMKITKASMEGSAPIYPPGTRNYGVRNYLHVPLSMNWKDAVLNARSSGGHLVVVGGIAEKFNMEKMTKDMDAEQGIWLGGFHLAGKGWRWTTGERWRSSTWPQDKPAKTPDAALLLRPGGAWDERSREQKASGYIIEWSEDHENVRN